MPTTETRHDRPNILIVFGEASRPDYFGAVGHPLVQTPNMDALINDGVYFDRAHCVAAQCAPSRTSLVTGLYPHTHGVMFNHIEYPTHHRSIAHYLNPIGYRTGWFGKGHNTPPRADFGFHEQKLCEGSNLPIYDDDYFLWLHEKGVDKATIYKLWDDIWDFHKDPYDRYSRKRRYRSPLSEEYSMSTWLAECAANFIDESADLGQPFFALVSHHAPQNDDALPSIYLDMYDPKDVPDPVGADDPDRFKDWIADYMAKTTQIDTMVGSIVSLLEAKGILEDTIIIFSADHACFLGEYNQANKLWTYEKDTRIPMIFWNPKRFQRGVRERGHFSNIDVMPTLMELLGLHIPFKLQGVSQLPVLRGETDSVRSTAFCESGPAGKQRKAIWKDDWKLLYRSGLNALELYNLADDPDETNNLADDPRHKDTLNDMIMTMLAEIVHTERPQLEMTEIARKSQAALFKRI